MVSVFVHIPRYQMVEGPPGSRSSKNVCVLMKCYWLSGWRSHILGRVELGLLSRRNTLLYPEHNNNDNIINSKKEKEVTKKNEQPITNINAFKAFRGHSHRGNIKHTVKKKLIHKKLTFYSPE